MAKRTSKRCFLHFQQNMKEQIDSTQQDQFSLIEEKKYINSEIDQIESRIGALTKQEISLFNQLEVIKHEREKKVIEAKQQFEMESKKLCEQPNLRLAEIDRTILKQTTDLKKIPQMPIGCEFETILLPDFAEMNLAGLENNFLVLTGDAILFINRFLKEIAVLDGELNDCLTDFRIVSITDFSKKAFNPFVKSLVCQKLRSDKIALPNPIFNRLVNYLSRTDFDIHSAACLTWIDRLSIDLKRQLVLKHVSDLMKTDRVFYYKGLWSGIRSEQTIDQKIISVYDRLLKAEILETDYITKLQLFEVRRGLVSLVYRETGHNGNLPQAPVKVGWFRRLLFKLLPFSFCQPKTIRQEAAVFKNYVKSSAIFKKHISLIPKIENPQKKLKQLALAKKHIIAAQNHKATIERELAETMKRSSERLIPTKEIDLKITQLESQLFNISLEKKSAENQLESLEKQLEAKEKEIIKTTDEVKYLKQADTPASSQNDSFEDCLQKFDGVMNTAKNLLENKIEFLRG